MAHPIEAELSKPQVKNGIDRKDIWNSIFSVGAEGFGRLLAILLSILIARGLGTEAFGDFSTAQSYALIFSVFFELGLYTLVFREVSKHLEKANIYLVNTLATEVILTIVVTLFLFLIVWILGYSQQMTIAIAICWIWVLTIGYGRIVRVVFRAHRAMGLDSMLNTLDTLLRSVLVIATILYKPSVINVTLMFALSSLITFLISLAIVHRQFFRINWGFERSFVQRLMLQSIPFAVTTIFTVSIYRLDTILLSIQRNNYEVGIYNAAYRLNLNFFFIPALICTALFPKLSALSLADNASAFHTIVASLYRILTILVFPMLILIFVFSDSIITTLYGTQYQESIRLLQILTWVNLLTSWNYVATNSLNALGKERSVAVALGVALLTNTLLNLLLIPHYGFFASTWVSVITEVVSVITLHLQLAHSVRFRQIIAQADAKKIGLVLAVTVALILILRLLQMPVILIALVFVILYGLMVYKTELIKDEISLLFQTRLLRGS